MEILCWGALSKAGYMRSLGAVTVSLDHTAKKQEECVYKLDGIQDIETVEYTVLFQNEVKETLGQLVGLRECHKTIHAQ